MLVGQRLDLDSVAAELSSTTPVEVPPDPGFAIARGAAQTADDAGFAAAAAATQMAPAASDATQMAPAVATRRRWPAADATQMAPAAEGRSRAAAGLLARRAGLLRDARGFARGVRSGAGRRGGIHRGDRAATAKGNAHGQCALVRGDQFRDAGRRGRGQHPAGRRRRGAAGPAGRVGYGAGALPACGAARGGSGGVADRGGVATARRPGPAEGPDQPGPGAQ